MTDDREVAVLEQAQVEQRVLGLERVQNTKPATMSSPMVPGMTTLGEKKVPSPGIDETP